MSCSFEEKVSLEMLDADINLLYTLNLNKEVTAMKIEKVNEHQIRCTLTQEDLTRRHIKLSELAYGSDKAKQLFRELMQMAATEYGFEADDIPLMIEAIPLSPEKIMLIVTKVESPEELDTRFSSFTHTDEAEEADEDSEEAFTTVDDASNELLELFSRLKEEKERLSAGETGAQTETKKSESPSGLTRLFSFRDLENAIEAAHRLDGFYCGRSTLYRDSGEDCYRLVVHQGRHDISDFNRINNLLCAYLTAQKSVPGAEAYYAEHLDVIIRGSALQELAQL